MKTWSLHKLVCTCVFTVVSAEAAHLFLKDEWVNECAAALQEGLIPAPSDKPQDHASRKSVPTEHVLCDSAHKRLRNRDTLKQRPVERESEVDQRFLRAGEGRGGQTLVFRRW